MSLKTKYAFLTVFVTLASLSAFVGNSFICGMNVAFAFSVVSDIISHGCSS